MLYLFVYNSLASVSMFCFSAPRETGFHQSAVLAYPSVISLLGNFPRPFCREEGRHRMIGLAVAIDYLPQQ